MNNVVFINHYEKLGVSKNASDEEIKKAYRSLARIHHPDNPTANPEKMKEINCAFDIIGDSEKRKTYDLEYNEYYNRTNRTIASNHSEQSNSNKPINKEEANKKAFFDEAWKILNPTYNYSESKVNNEDSSSKLGTAQLDLALTKIELERAEKNKAEKETKLTEQKKLGNIIAERAKSEYDTRMKKYNDDFNESFSQLQTDINNLNKKHDLFHQKKIEEQKVMLNDKLNELIKEKDNKIKKAEEVYQFEISLKEEGIKRTMDEIDKINNNITDLKAKIDELNKEIEMINNPSAYQSNVK